MIDETIKEANVAGDGAGAVNLKKDIPLFTKPNG